MAVKYVKDFAFDSGFGFSGSSGKTPVRAYMRGGAVKSNPTKAPSIAPAMVEKRSQGLGGLAKETKKLAAYDKPHVAGKKGAKVAQYAKGGVVKKAEGGSVVSKAKMTRTPTEGELKALSSKPSSLSESKKAEILRQFKEIVGPTPTEAERKILQAAMDAARSEYAKGGKVKKEMPSFLKAKMMKKANGGPVAEITEGDGMSPLQAMAMPIGDLTPVPEEPSYDLEAGMQAGLSNPTRPMLPAPIEPGAGGSGVRSGTGSLRDLGVGLGRLPSPLAAAGREAAKMGRREMMADRREAARDIMDRYIAGPRRAMGARGIGESRARRAMPVAPSKPMIDRSMLQPYMPSIRATTPEESDAYFKSIGRTPSPEARFAKGGKVSKGEKKIGKVMGEFKRGELHSGSKKGPVVKNPKQAVAIALSEARAAGAKVPKRKAMGGKACG